MAKGKKRQYDNKRKQKKPYSPPVNPKPRPVEEETEEEKQAFIERYGTGGVIKNVIRIWRDTSRLSFITYFPVVLFELAYSVLWLLLSILIFIPPVRQAGILGRDYLVLANSILAAAGLPLLVSILHLVHNIKTRKYSFTNVFRYILPASLVYLALDFVNIFIAVVFSKDRWASIVNKLETTGIQALVMIGVISLFGILAQVILHQKKQRYEPQLLGNRSIK